MHEGLPQEIEKNGVIVVVPLDLQLRCYSQPLCCEAVDDKQKLGEVDTTGSRQARKRVLDIEVTCGCHGVSPCGMGFQADQNVTPASAFLTVGHSKSLRMGTSEKA